MAFTSGLVTRLRHSNVQIESLNTESLKIRVMRALFDLSQNSDDCVINITQERLAANVSASREKVNVTLKAIENTVLFQLGVGKLKSMIC